MTTWNNGLHILFCALFIGIPAISILYYIGKKETEFKGVQKIRRPKSLYNKPY